MRLKDGKLFHIQGEGLRSLVCSSWSECSFF